MVLQPQHAVGGRWSPLLVLLCVGTAIVAVAAVGTGVGTGVPVPTPQPAVAKQALQPRFQEVVTAATSVNAAKAAVTAAAAAAAGARGGVAGHEGSREHSAARAGGEWWVKDPPWFLPPPPEWGPMPPTMYTSFFHKPRYPALSTANYYPLYTREDEYDAHLPASMSRRAAHTQQLLYDHYVATYRDHMNGGPNAPLPMGDPNTGVRNPALLGALGADGGMAAAHMDAMQLQHPNNYVPGFSGGFRGAPSFVNGGAGGFGAGMALAGAFVETQAHAHAHAHATTHFTASPLPRFVQTDSDTDAADDEADDAEAETEETEVTDSDEADADADADADAEVTDDADADSEADAEDSADDA